MNSLIKLLQAYDDINPEVLLDALGIESELKSDELFFICPNPDHNDTNPSCSLNINPESEYFLKYSCFGCNNGGNLLDLVQLVKGCDLKEAKDFIIKISEEGEEWITPSWSPHFQEKKEATIEIPKEFVRFTNEDNSYRKYLIEKRKLSDEDIKQQGWGYCPTGRYAKRVVLPIYIKGKLVNLYARHISTVNKANKVWNAPGSIMDEVVWDYSSIDFEKSYIWITESVFNRISLIKAGIDNCLCVFGDKISESKLKMLEPFREIRIVPDGDDPSKRLLEDVFKYYGKNKVVKSITIPLGEDANSLDLDDLKAQLKTLTTIRPNDFRSHLVEIDYSIPKKNN